MCSTKWIKDWEKIIITISPFMTSFAFQSSTYSGIFPNQIIQTNRRDDDHSDNNLLDRGRNV
jgi:hypothetical protein